MRLTLVFVFLLFLCSISLGQTTWYVPDDFSTIQGAISDASVLNGDTVIVRPGTYMENIDFLGKAITLKSDKGSKATVIDGNQADSVVSIRHSILSASLDGFTITNGSSHHGSGIYCFCASPSIRNNIIIGNASAMYGAGGGIHCFESSPTITNNIITKNSAGKGGGIYCEWCCYPTITNTTITENTAGEGDGLFCYDKVTATVTNTIIWDNDVWVTTDSFASILNISYSNLKGGEPCVYVDPNCHLYWGSGMIDSDPMFIDSANHDFHLNYTSPCRDTGDNSAPNLPTYDFEGDPRIAYGTVDMGADEFHPHLYYTGDASPLGAIQAKCIGLPGTLVNGIILGINIFDPALPCDYGLWYMDNPMQIITGLGPVPSDGVAVFPGTIPATPSGPYTIYLQAAIDSWLTNLCVVEVE